ncbi:MAG: Crp/Fnr family transcriptional regulator [Acidobacteriota bacterium]
MNVRTNDPRGVDGDLRRIPCLARVDPAFALKLRGGVEERVFPKGAIIVRQGTVWGKILLVVKGRIRLWRLGDGGSHTTLRILGEGDCLCFAPGHLSYPSPVTVQCLCESRLMLAGRRQLEGLATKDPGFTRQVMACLLSRLSDAMRQVGPGARRPVRRRVAAALVELVALQGLEREEGLSIDGVTHEEIAGLAGTAREVVSRALKLFQEERVLTTGRARILIRDPGRLQAIALGSSGKAPV